MDLTYKQKYLLYKKRYITLRDQFGSSETNIQSQGKTFISFIVSHSGRMSCLMDTLGFNNLSKKKFKNCAIIELEVNPKKIKIRMIYEGELESKSEVNDKYFSIGDNINEENENRTINTYGQTFIFYIMRHGDGMHNEAKEHGFITKTFQVIKMQLFDAELTEKGIQQAINAGQAFSNIVNSKITSGGGFVKTVEKDPLVARVTSLKTFEPSKHFLFASDLKRTRQTLANFLMGFQMNLTDLTQVIILPCAHELDYKSKDCDANQLITAQENIMTCQAKAEDLKDKIPQNVLCTRLPVKEKQISLVWSYYNKFYGKEDGGSRKNKGKSATRCRSTNMIQMAINIILGK
jgi:broad specificity phosphatase PhoE